MTFEVISALGTQWESFGQGPRAAHLIHCNLAHLGAWAGVITGLEDEWTLVAVDLPGHGGSDWPDKTRDLQVQAAEVSAELISRRGEPVDLIGHSFGATVALRIALARPDLVRNLVLIEPVFFGVLADEGLTSFALEMEKDAAFVACLEQGDLRGAARFFVKRWGMPGEWDNLAERQKEYMASRMPLVGMGVEAIVRPGDQRLHAKDLERITCPTLLIEGEDSPSVIAAVQRVLAAKIPNVERRVVKGAGHMAPVTHAAKVAAEIRAFLISR